ncbi:hypothetical protein LUZ60_014547 [Juncus effusus]|nr:hypothetical protein LUZ60_014547 [Juncus effusus]
MEAFENYFKRADANQDGKISGSEAVAFFQGSDLPQQVLAQIWMYADQNKSGFLGRPEFFNALRLVTVAQGGHELKPDIVNSALYGPAAAKIPPPKINSVAAPTAQASPAVPQQQIQQPSPQMGQGALNAGQYAGARAPQTGIPPNMGLMRPNQPGVSQGFAGSVPSQMPGVSQGFAGSVPSQMPGGSQGFVGGVPTQSPLQRPGVSQGFGGGVPTQSPLQRPGVSQGFGGGVPSQSPLQRPGFSQGFGGAVPSQSPLQMPGGSQGLTGQSPGGGLGLAGGNTGMGPRPVGSNTLSGLSADWLGNRTVGAQPRAPATSDAFGLSSLTSTTGVTAQRPPAQQILSSLSQPAPPAGDSKALVLSDLYGLNSQPKPSTTVASSAPLSGFAQLDPLRSSQVQPTQVKQDLGAPAGGPAQPQWPKMSKADVSKYTKVFGEVDKDRDGRITGVEARNLFLSWKLPREVLKQVWDLSDQDNDGMLTLREFCIALYLMERHRQGADLPKALPDSLRFDEALLQATGLPAGAYAAGPAWQQQQQQAAAMAQRPPVPGVGPGMMRPPLPAGHMHPHAKAGQSQTRPSQPGVDNNNNHVVNRDISGAQEVAGAERKATEVEKQILDSKEKIAYFRNKMQDLVLYKSRCDNRLNEIMERALSDKREVESLAKKYEEKYKQVGEIASKLAVEEASIRDIHERKTELQNAVVKMEQGGSADGLLQVRADRIQYQLEELEKALLDRCKHFGLHVKPSSNSIELPFGWEPGVPEGALDWDEDWDKFDDEGFMVVKPNTTEVEHVSPSPKEKTASPSFWNEDSSIWNDDSPVAPSSNGHTKFDAESKHSEDESPGRRSTVEESPFVNSPRLKDDFNDRDGAESSVFGDQYANEASWNFDETDTDSVWGANTFDADNQRNSFYGPGSDFGLDPVRVNSPTASSVYGKKKSSFFDDSVPSSPSFSAAGFSPKFNDYSSFNYGRFDSFKTEDSGSFFGQDNKNSSNNNAFGRFDSISSSKGEQLSRFDSMGSSVNVGGHNRGFDSFDEADPFGSAGPFKASGSGSSPRF